MAVLVVATTLAASSPAAAQSIVWGAPTNISGAGDVSTVGNLVAAHSLGNTAAAGGTVNGVTFLPFQAPNAPVPSVTVGNDTILETQAPGLFGYDTLNGSTSAPFTSLPSGYQSILASGVTPGVTETLQLVLNGLDVGSVYQVQLWANHSGPNGNPVNDFLFVTSGNSVTLSPHTAAGDGQLGQFVTGTFTATSTQQVISMEGQWTLGGPLTFGPLLNAFQLRLVAVPEPSPLALGAAVVAAFAGVRSLRRRGGGGFGGRR